MASRPFRRVAANEGNSSQLGMNALIVCHAGEGLGLGHLTRSLVVASALKQDLGATVRLIVQGDPVQRDDLAQFDHHFLGVDVDLSDTIRQQVDLVDLQVVVLDLHPSLVPTEIDVLLKLLRQNGCRVIGVDGLIGHSREIDLIFMPSFQFLKPDGFADTIPTLFGWDCFLLNVKCRPIEWEPGRQVLALAGGSDATNLGRSLPTLLNAALPDGTTLHWVTGPFAQNPVWPLSPRFPMVYHHPPSGLDDLMLKTNYAVTVYGVSFFELLYYGVPTVVFSPYGNKDDAELAAIAAEGVALVAWNENEAVSKLNELMSDHALARSLSQRAKQMLAVSGGKKFTKAIAALLE